MVDSGFYAHSTKDKQASLSQWNPLATHLKNVGDLASYFCSNQQLKKIAWYAGRWHDIGKYRQSFQNYLKARGKISSSKDNHHAVYGAYLAYQLKNDAIAFAIAGHHSGLHNPAQLKSLFTEYDNLDQEISDLCKLYEQELDPLTAIEEINDPLFVTQALDNISLDSDKVLVKEFYIRMVFSSLTDADVLDAIRFSKKLRKTPSSRTLDHQKLIDKLDNHIKYLELSTQQNPQIAEIRKKVYQYCHSSGSLDQGFFQLTVPTGGGKTLSSMRFALEHAKHHNLQRIIVVIPYLSIIEQNAQIYRQIFDSQDQEVVLEHHSAVIQDQDSTEKHNGPSKTTQAAQNWDGEIIVTTTVQFVESLFSNHPGRCRKLHNIANSVVILDEVHTLGLNLVNPLLSVLRELKTNYRTSIVLSTATQPAYLKSKNLKYGFCKQDQVREIIPDTQELFSKLSRIKVICDIDKTISWKQLSQKWIQNHTKALGIVNTRDHAAKWYDQLKQTTQSNVFHLSSAMCAQHRSDVLSKVKEKLKNNNELCYLISTQVVEAGVDIDFNSVYRAIAPLDSIIQAAGRCNREKKLTDHLNRSIDGQLVVFNPEDQGLPSGVYNHATALTCNFLKSYDLNGADINQIINNPRVFSQYFAKLFAFIGQDSEGSSIQSLRKNFQFRTVCELAKVIDQNTYSIIVPYQGYQVFVEDIKQKYHQYGFITADETKYLQRYMVNVTKNIWDQINKHSLITEIVEGYPYYLLDCSIYDQDLGLKLKKDLSDL